MIQEERSYDNIHAKRMKSLYIQSFMFVSMSVCIVGFGDTRGDSISESYYILKLSLLKAVNKNERRQV